MDYETWSYKDIENFYDRVRMALGSVTETVVSNEEIDYPEKAPFAELSIKSRIPSWKELSEEKFKMFESAIVYQTASLFQGVVSTKRITKKQIPTITLEYSSAVDFSVNGMSISDLVDYLVSVINGESVGSSFIGFRVTRGSSNWRSL